MYIILEMSYLSKVSEIRGKRISEVFNLEDTVLINLPSSYNPISKGEEIESIKRSYLGEGFGK